MKRRRFLQTLAASPAVPPLLAQQPPAPPSSNAAPAAPGGGPSYGSAQDLPVIKAVAPDTAADSVPRFFSPAQLESLRKLSDILMPPMDGMPGAVEAQAAEFLDFLIGVSPAPRQQFYRDGLELLDSRSREKFVQAFASLSPSQAAAILRPLDEPWPYDAPADPRARFLRAAHLDIRRATQNSRQRMAATPSTGRRPGGIGLYWLPIDPIV